MPIGIRILARSAPEIIPWAWGVNGIASVLASVLGAFVIRAIFLWGVLIAAPNIADEAAGIVSQGRRLGIDAKVPFIGGDHRVEQRAETP